MKKTITDKTVDADVLAYTVGDDPVLDLALAKWDCMGTAAHVTMLSEMKGLKRPIVTKAEAAKVRKELGRIAKLAKDLGLTPKTVGLIVNRAPNGELNDGIREEIGLQGLNLLGVVPHDEMIYEYDGAGKPTVEIPASAPVRKAFDEIISKLNFN